MKIKIEYKYEMGIRHPFRATTYLDGNYMVGVSAFSFDEAREDLIKDVKEVIEKMPTVIPESEEVEL